MKKTLKILLPVLTIGMLTGCQISTNNSSQNGGTNNNGSNPSAQSEQVYAFEAITSAGLLHSLNNNQDVLAVKKAKADETLVNQIKDYLPSVEAALTNQSLMTSSEVVASDRNEYATKVIITYTDIAFINQTMTMYYNETAIPDDDFDDDWDDQFEEEYVIDGLIIIDDVEYQMFGKKELDQDEYEVSFTYQIDENNYIKVEQEIENDESEFNYTVIQNRRKVYEYSLEVEDNSVELEVKDRNLGVEKMEFEFLRRDNRTYIIAEVRQNGVSSEIVFEKVVDELNNVTYNVISNR